MVHSRVIYKNCWKIINSKLISTTISRILLYFDAGPGTRIIASPLVIQQRYACRRETEWRCIMFRVLCRHGWLQSLEEADNRMAFISETQSTDRYGTQENSRFRRCCDTRQLSLIVPKYWQGHPALRWLWCSQQQKIDQSQWVLWIHREMNSLALPFFHAFSDCDSTSLIYKKSKMSLYYYYSSVYSLCYKDRTSSFCQLNWLPTESVINLCSPVIYNFVKSVFGGNSYCKQFGSFGDIRLQLFKASSSDNFRELPPSEESLELYIRNNSTRQDECGVTPPVKNQFQKFGWTVHPNNLVT